MMPIAYKIKGYKYIVPDFYGFGESLHPEYPLKIDDYADGILDILRKEKIDSAIFICHSFGGRVGCYIASRSNIVKKLILCDSAGIKPKRHIEYYIKIWFYRIRKRLGLSVENYGSPDYRALDTFVKKTFINVVNYDQTKEIKSIKCPTLIVWGENDRETPLYMARKFKRGIKDSKLVVISGAGHFAYADDVNAFSKIVTRFIKE